MEVYQRISFPVPTKKRMLKWGFNGDSAFVFCRNCAENRNHLFFEWPLSKRIWRSSIGFCLVITGPILKWDALVNSTGGASQLTGNGMRTTICKLAWWATVYNLWLQRNDIFHAGMILTEEQITRCIKKDIKNRMWSSNNYEDSVLNQVLWRNRGMNLGILRPAAH